MARTDFLKKLEQMNTESDAILSELYKMAENSKHLQEQFKSIADEYKFQTERAFRKALTDYADAIESKLTFDEEEITEEMADEEITN